MEILHFNMFCFACGTKLINGDCGNCLSNSNALKNFEDEDD
jgi:hypothetical protein